MHRSTFRQSSTLVLALAPLAIAVSAAATVLGPDWEEPMHGDAGSLPGTAQKVTGVGSLSSIHGFLSVALDAPDYEDMYEITIDCPIGITFKAGTDPSFGGSGDFNTQLFLFSAAGKGLLGNNDVTPSMGLSGFGNMSNDGTGIVVTAPGTYYIAVSGLGNVPVSSATLPLFALANPLEVSGPDGLGGGSPIAGWTGSGAVGEYLISFSTCAQFVPPPPCPADLDGNGVVDGADLGLLLGDWGDGPSSADLNGDGSVNGADMGLLLAAWGPCVVMSGGRE